MANTSLAQKLAQRQQKFIEDRIMASKWCEELVASYDAISERIQDGLPPLPGRTPQELLPSLFQEKFDKDAYARESAVLTGIQKAMLAKAVAFNEVAAECLSM